MSAAWLVGPYGAWLLSNVLPIGPPIVISTITYKYKPQVGAKKYTGVHLTLHSIAAIYCYKPEKKKVWLTRQILGTFGRVGKLKKHSHDVELQKSIKTDGKVAVDCFYPDHKAARVPLLKTHWSTPVLQKAHWTVLVARRPLVKFSHLQ